MRVHKNFLGTSGQDKIHVDEIAVTPDLLLGGAVIVESGSNANGEYRRFGDGTQICWGIANISGEGWSGSGDKRWSALHTITLPKSFATTAGMVFTGSVRDDQTAIRSARLTYFSLGTSAISSVTLSGWGVAPSRDALLHWQVVGRWK